MTIPTSVSWASSILGFISFAITLATLLGVYGDVIATVRNAPAQIPIQLGNLRQEIESERFILRQRCRRIVAAGENGPDAGDEFGVFAGQTGSAPRAGRGEGNETGRGRRRRRSQRRRRRMNEVLHLLMRTVDRLWSEFRQVERPFLVRNGRRAEEIRKGDFWGESDVDEKGAERRLSGAAAREGGRGRSDRKMMKQEEEDVGLEGDYYYRTDLTHRFIWWQSKRDVDSLAEQVQRVQIRRIERDVFEVDELVKRVVRRMEGGDDNDAGQSDSGSGSDDVGPRGGGGSGGESIRRASRRSVGGGGQATYEARETETIRIPARSRAGSVRMASRANSAPRPASRVRSISPPKRRSPRLRERNGDDAGSPVEPRPSNTARRRQARESDGPAYEVVRPGRDGIYTIDINRPPSRPGLRDGQGQSYYRERPRRDSDPRDGDRRTPDRSSRARYNEDGY